MSEQEQDTSDRQGRALPDFHPEALPLRFINHVLRQQVWALERLKGHAGKTILATLPLFQVRCRIGASGELEVAPADAAADVEMQLTPGLAVRILASDVSAYNEVEMSGDAALATDLAAMAQQLRWDVEEDLSHVVGDILAHRIVASGEKLFAWQKHTLIGFAQTLAEYWTEEQPLLAKPRGVRQFVSDVDTLRDDTARLEKRLEQLEQKPGSAQGDKA